MSPITRFRNAFPFLYRHRNAVLFFVGFVFDTFTVVRIDAMLDLVWQLFYLSALTFILVRQYREHQGFWRPGPLIARAWKYNVEILHFMYGGLLSMYTILYFKSSSGSRVIVFFMLIVLLMVVNEMPQIRQYGHRLRLGLYAFCLASYMIYLVPILLGTMNALTFVLSLAIAGVIVWGVSGLLAKGSDDVHLMRAHLFAPAGAVLFIIAICYALHFIPPVPLSVQFAGVYHSVEKTPEGYEFKTLEKPWYRLWRKQSRPFLARPGDTLYYFVRLYAPARFHHNVRIRWLFRRNGKYISSDVMPLSVIGGRLEGFRGYAAKSNYQPGQWRVLAETEDGRIIGALSFDVEPDLSTNERRWVVLRDEG